LIADRAFRNRVVAGPMDAIELRGGCFNRQVDEPEILVHADLAPDADVAVLRPRAVLPRLAAVLAGPWNGVELAELLPRAYVERADEPFRVVVRLDGSSLPERGPDDRDVSRNRRRRMDANLAGLEINLLVGAVNSAYLQIDEAVLAER